MIRIAQVEDFDFFLQIKSDDDNMYWCGYSSKPIAGNLYSFWLKNVGIERTNINRTIYIIEDNGYPAGYIYEDTKPDSCCEVSIAVISSKAGRGVGTMAIQDFIDICKEKDYLKIVANIREDNIRSQHIFSKTGFCHTGVSYLQKLENDSKEILMLEYIYDLMH